MPELLLAESRKRQCTEDLDACRKVVLRTLKRRPAGTVGNGVTAGWIADRSIGFSEFAIGITLRKLRTDRVVKRVMEGALICWSIRTKDDDVRKADLSEDEPNEETDAE